jgi:hypothetical protein
VGTSADEAGLSKAAIKKPNSNSRVYSSIPVVMVLQGLCVCCVMRTPSCQTCTTALSQRSDTHLRNLYVTPCHNMWQLAPVEDCHLRLGTCPSTPLAGTVNQQLNTMQACMRPGAHKYKLTHVRQPIP